MSVMGKNKKAMKCDRSFFAASLLLSLTILIFLFSFVGEDLLCWIERHSGLASWVQAVGSISVILVMFYQVHKEIAEKRLERSMNEETMLFKTMLFLRRKHLLRSLNTLFCNYKKYKNNIFSEEGKFAYPAIFFIRITESNVTSVYADFQQITDDELEKYATLEIIRIRESINELNAVYSFASKKLLM